MNLPEIFNLKKYYTEVKENFSSNKNNLLLFILISIILLIADQITKQIALKILISKPYNSVEVLSFFNFSLIINTGVSFGMLSKIPFAREIISLIVIPIALFIFFLLLKEKRSEIRCAYALIFSGAIGNTIDRLLYGGVIDFLDFHINSLHYPAFNIADSSIFVGAVIFIFSDFIRKIIFKK